MSKSANESEHSVNLNSRRECEEIMDAIYKENPSYWPYGLSIGSHDGGVYMIREASTKRPVGFTGWQEREENGQKVGYYSIGILSDYRNNGYAKQAVAKLIKIKSANVDRVQALIMKHNQPSLALAEKLGIPVVKEGSTKKAFSKALPAIAGGIGNAAFFDYLGQGNKSPLNKDYWEDMSRDRIGMAFLNTLLGAGGGHMIGKGVGGMARGTAGSAELIPAGAATIALSPVKDWVMRSLPAAQKLPGALDSLTELSNRPASKGILESLSPTQKAVGAGAGLLAAAGLGYLGTKAVRSLQDMSNAQRQSAGGRIKVTLPTKDPTDEETTMDIPMEDLEVSRSQQTKLLRDLRRKIRRESKERTMRRTMGHFLPDTGSKSASLPKIKNLLNIIYGS